jgi:deuterolysin
MFTLPQCAFAVAAFAHFSNAARLDTYKKDSALQVTLNAVENSIVKATVVNTGNEDLNLLKFGSLLDSAPVQKLNVYTVGTY